MNIPEILFYKPTVVKRTWGIEIIIDNNDKYCGKMLLYYQKNVKSSAHYHSKSESMICQQGNFNFYYWDNKGNKQMRLMVVGDAVQIPGFRPHQLEPLQDYSMMFECSTPHSDADVIRFEPSQKINNIEDIEILTCSKCGERAGEEFFYSENLCNGCNQNYQ